jgi:hypothetical protein
MKYKPDIFVEQFPIVKRFVYHLVYYKELWRAYSESQLASSFWTHTVDAHLLQAAIQWCMVFGTDGCNPTHWKHLSDEAPTDLKNRFRADLPGHVGITYPDFEQYWREMKDFRDNYAAHRELKYQKAVPKFGIALKVAYFYDHWIREVISPDVFEEPPLEESVTKLKKALPPFLATLMTVTSQYDGVGWDRDE